MDTFKDSTEDDSKSSAKHKLREHADRIQAILKRGDDAGLKEISDDFKKKSNHAMAGLLAYTAIIKLIRNGPFSDIPVPQTIEEKMVKALNDMDDQMTLEISGIKV